MPKYLISAMNKKDAKDMAKGKGIVDYMYIPERAIDSGIRNMKLMGRCTSNAFLIGNFNPLERLRLTMFPTVAEELHAHITRHYTEGSGTFKVPHDEFFNGLKIMFRVCCDKKLSDILLRKSDADGICSNCCLK